MSRRQTDVKCARNKLFFLPVSSSLLLLGRQILVGVFLLFGIFLYGIFVGLPEEGQTTVGSPKGKGTVTPCGDCDLPSSADVKTPWRSFNYKQLNVPASISSGASQVKPLESTVIIDGLTVYYQEVTPKDAYTDISVLMLHGAAFKSETWYNLGTLGSLSLMGYRVVAIDMPAFVQHLLAALHLNNPVIVSPSLSGQLSLPFLVKHWQQMAGYVPVAPVGWNVLEQVQCNTGEAPVDVSQVYPPLQVHLPKQVPNLSCIKVPTMVVFGEHDRSTSSALLNLLPNSVAVEVPHGRHPAYLDNPILWHQALYNFLLRLRYGLQQQAVKGSS
ncbi:hypothetical protein HPB49_005884 [Dermacentor silvarum]|uniref:Uncharacterized protein n=1 Tax=Dermacentor silvarum TaxID=543639 RepID=A0ACB8C7J5_DERSI|nr:hypothetical protein HPB49_005884 [Dermacentor silvarum]